MTGALGTFLLLLLLGYGVARGLRARSWPSVLGLMALGLAARSSGLVGSAYLEAAPAISAGAFALLLVRAGASLESRGRPRALHASAVALLRLATPVALEWAGVFLLARALLGLEVRSAALAAFLVGAVSPALMLPSLLRQARRRAADDRPVLLQVGVQVILNALCAQTGILLLLASFDGDARAPSLLLFWLSWPAAYLLGRIFPSGFPARSPRLAALLLAGAGIGVYLAGVALGLESIVATLIFAATALRGQDERRRRHAGTLETAWTWAEIPLFVNLGAAVRIDAVMATGAGAIIASVALVAAAVLLRSAAARLVMVEARQGRWARRYLVVAQLPRATIQAVFGVVVHRALSGVPGMAETAEVLLLTSVMTIVLTAPLGALALERAERS